MVPDENDPRYALELNEKEFDVTLMAVEIALEDAKNLAETTAEDFVPVKKDIVQNFEDMLEMQEIAKDNVVHLQSVYDKLHTEGGDHNDNDTNG